MICGVWDENLLKHPLHFIYLNIFALNCANGFNSRPIVSVWCGIVLFCLALRSKQNGWHFQDDIFKYSFLSDILESLQSKIVFSKEFHISLFLNAQFTVGHTEVVLIMVRNHPGSRINVCALPRSICVLSGMDELNCKSGKILQEIFLT